MKISKIILATSSILTFSCYTFETKANHLQEIQSIYKTIKRSIPAMFKDNVSARRIYNNPFTQKVSFQDLLSHKRNYTTIPNGEKFNDIINKTAEELGITYNTSLMQRYNILKKADPNANLLAPSAPLADHIQHVQNNCVTTVEKSDAVVKSKLKEPLNNFIEEAQKIANAKTSKNFSIVKNRTFDEKFNERKYSLSQSLESLRSIPTESLIDTNTKLLKINPITFWLIDYRTSVLMSAAVNVLVESLD